MANLSRRITCLLAMFLPVLAQSALPPGSIDGAVSPDQIPDFVALRLFIAAVAVPSGGPAAQAMATSMQAVARQKSKLAPAGLDDADTTVVLQAIQSWQSKVSTGASSPTNSSPAVNLDATAKDLLIMLQGQMTPRGFASLMAYIRTEKKHMKIIPVPDMSGHKH